MESDFIIIGFVVIVVVVRGFAGSLDIEIASLPPSPLKVESLGGVA